MAIDRQRPAPGLVHHGDRGVLRSGRLPQRPCRRRDPAVDEPEGDLPRQRADRERLATLKVERVHRRVYAPHDEARRDLCASVEGFHDSRPLLSAIGCRSPADMEHRAA